MTIRRHRRRLPVVVVPAQLRGLRPRLVVAFVLVALMSGAAATGASYREARTAVLKSAQNSAIDKTREQLRALAPTISLPPDHTELQRIANRLAGEVLVVYGDLQEPAPELAPQIPTELRRRVHTDGGLRYQRVKSGGAAFLTYGMPVQTTGGEPSGVELYVRTDLRIPQRSIEDLTWSAGEFTAISLIIAVLLALVAAQGVLRPVRELRLAARQLAAGKLDTRLRERGADELAELVRTFNTTASELEYNVGALRRMEANARRFVADVSHELRTPLAAMTAVTDTLDEEAANLHGDAATAARLISTETRRLALLVDNLIEITRFDAGRAELRLDSDGDGDAAGDGAVDLPSVIAATLAARGWTEQVTTDVATGLTAQVDRRRLDVIVANLVGNALRHGQPPVTVTVRCEPGPDRRDWVHLLVTDHGPGLPPEIVPHVFERFFKADMARTRSDGSGLGLAIALENARLHGGTIEASSRPGRGAAFLVRLPRWQVAHAATATAAVADRQPPSTRAPIPAVPA